MLEASLKVLIFSERDRQLGSWRQLLIIYKSVREKKKRVVLLETVWLCECHNFVVVERLALRC